MRKGWSPQKSEPKIELKTNHRVIVVVFIPELSGYYEKMFQIVKLCIGSLIKTVPMSSAITIVDNGSCREVGNYFNRLFEKKEISTLKLYSENIGKIDALIGELRASREPLITMTDCDILFKDFWVEETFKIFNKFKNVGSVAPYPSRKATTYFTFSAQEAVLRHKLNLNFEPIPENFFDYNRFLSSINFNKEVDANFVWPVIKNGKNRAIIGSEHQVLTVRRDIFFNNAPFEPSFVKVGTYSEMEYVDRSIDLSGGLRLSLYNYYAYHMANEIESWMTEKFKNLKKSENTLLELELNPKLFYRQRLEDSYKMKKLVVKLLFKRKIPREYYK